MSRVLVVDDDPTVLDLILKILRGDGLEAVGVGSVSEAIRTEGPWSLLLVDFSLPNGNGIEIAQHWHEVPAVFVSGREGADLQKPFTTQELRDIVQTKLLKEA